MLYLGSDHAGFRLKEKVKDFLDKKGIKYQDYGNKVFDPTDDYVDFAKKVGKRIGRKNRGLLFCGSGYGMCIAANKIKNVRAVNIQTVRDAEISRMHNDSNVLCLSGWDVNYNLAKKIIIKWLDADFSGEERHIRRIRKIRELDKRCK